MAHILLVVLTVTAAVELSRAAMLVTLKLPPAPARYVSLGACLVIVGILFAPAGGKKTRHNIQKEINKAGETVKDNYEKIAKETGKGLEAIASHLKR